MNNKVSPPLTDNGGLIILDDLVLRTPIRSQRLITDQESIDLELRDPKVLEAIYVASPDLHSQFLSYKKGEKLDKKKEDRLYRSLYKYFARMHNRATPFGLFSGCSVTKFGKIGPVIIDSTHTIKRHSRLDMHFLGQVVSNLEENLQLRPYLTFYPNSTIQHYDSNITYINFAYNGEKKEFTTNYADKDNYLSWVLSQASGGIVLSELRKGLERFDNDLTSEEVEEYLQTLVDLQILVSELQPNLTGIQPDFLLASKLLQVSKRGAVFASKFAKSYTKLLQCVQKINEEGFAKEKSYKDLLAAAKNISVKVNERKLLQTEVTINLNKNSAVKETVKESLSDCLNALAPFAKLDFSSRLVEFGNTFLTRYQDSSVPLLQVLDTERGIGYPVNNTNVVNPLLEIAPKIPAPRPGPTDGLSVHLDALSSIIYREIISGKSVAQIDLSTIPEVANAQNLDNTPFSLTMPVHFSLVGNETEESMVNLIGMGGVSATDLLARFASHNEEIEEVINKISKYEEEGTPDGQVLAEILHLPNDRIGNVLIRPSFRKYEIPYLTPSILNEKRQISLNDITIRVQSSQSFPRIILYSKKLNKEIIPRLSTAHNFNLSSHPVYRLLCDLQYSKEKTSVGFSPTALGNVLRKVPRVVYKNVIVSPATWLLGRKDFKELLDNKKESLEKWQNHWGIPSLLLLVQGDNELLIDLEKKLSLDTFLDVIKKRNQIKLTEFLSASTTNALVINDKGEPHANEFLGIIQRKVPSDSNLSRTKVSETIKRTNIQRNFPVGQKWLYFKIYCGVAFGDELIAKYLGPLAKKMKIQDNIQKWFYIRYLDPGFHLRFRVEVNDSNDIGNIFEQINSCLSPALKDGWISDIKLESYSRELERYGFDNIEKSEEVFFRDSTESITVINQLLNEDNKHQRWHYALATMDTYLERSQFTIEQKKDFTTSLVNSFGQEFSYREKSYRKQLIKSYRNLESEIANLLKDKATSISDQLYSDDSGQVLENILNGIRLSCSPDAYRSYLASYIHMSMNRLFPSKARYQEFLIYFYLMKYYNSVLSKSRAMNLKDT